MSTSVSFIGGAFLNVRCFALTNILSFAVRERMPEEIFPVTVVLLGLDLVKGRKLRLKDKHFEGAPSRPQHNRSPNTNTNTEDQS